MYNLQLTCLFVHLKIDIKKEFSHLTTVKKDSRSALKQSVTSNIVLTWFSQPLFQGKLLLPALSKISCLYICMKSHFLTQSLNIQQHATCSFAPNILIYSKINIKIAEFSFFFLFSFTSKR